MSHHDRPPEKADQSRGDVARQLRAPVEDGQDRDHDQPRPNHPVHARQIVSHKRFIEHKEVIYQVLSRIRNPNYDNGLVE